MDHLTPTEIAWNYQDAIKGMRSASVTMDANAQRWWENYLPPQRQADIDRARASFARHYADAVAWANRAPGQPWPNLIRQPKGA